MLGQVYSDQKYTVIILAGGRGTRLGDAAEYLPKALVPLGTQRAIDWLIWRHLPVAQSFVIGTGWQADLLESYVKGRYPNLPITFSHEEQLHNNAWSLLYALDHVDSRLPVLITFCDVLLLSHPHLGGDTLYCVTEHTKGVTGTFRHTVGYTTLVIESVPQQSTLRIIPSTIPVSTGLLGYFVCQQTTRLKAIAYQSATKQPPQLHDLTEDIIMPYLAAVPMCVQRVEAVVEFGTDTTLTQARQLWETL